MRFLRYLMLVWGIYGIAFAVANDAGPFPMLAGGFAVAAYISMQEAE